MKVGQLLGSDRGVACLLYVLGCHALCQSLVMGRHSRTGYDTLSGLPTAEYGAGRWLWLIDINLFSFMIMQRLAV